MNIKFRYDGKRREVSLHNFRHFVYTTVDGLGQNQFAEYFIGHANSTYWRKPESEKIATFLKIEPYLTFLDVASLEAKGADQQTRIEQVQTENFALKQQIENLYKTLYEQGVIKKKQSPANIVN
jgi:hypothetical protein